MKIKKSVSLDFQNLKLKKCLATRGKKERERERARKNKVCSSGNLFFINFFDVMRVHLIQNNNFLNKSDRNADHLSFIRK